MTQEGDVKEAAFVDVTPKPIPMIETAHERPAPGPRETVFDIRDLAVLYGKTTALSGVNLDIYRNLVTALIGPSGCGKSTFIRCLNRMNDLVPSFSQTGTIPYHGHDIAGKDVDP